MESQETFLSFKLDNEFFAIQVMKVMEILEVPKVTKIPKSPDYLLGVLNLRGSVLPLIDTRMNYLLTKDQ
jgi:purine-binding chemotaxis protein CheW